MAYIDLGNVKGEKGDRGLQGKGTAFFGKCDTNSDISIKDIKLIEDSIVEPYDGLVIFVKFTHENNSSVLSLTIDGETTFDVDIDETVSWKAGDSVLFAFAENKWHYLEGTGTPFNTKTGVVDTKTLNVGEQENYHTEVKTDSSNDAKTGGLNGTITGNRLILKSKTGENIEKLPSFDGTTAESRLNEFGGIETNGYISAPYFDARAALQAAEINSSRATINAIDSANIASESIKKSFDKGGQAELLAPILLYKGQKLAPLTLTFNTDEYEYLDITFRYPFFELSDTSVAHSVTTIRMNKEEYQLGHVVHLDYFDKNSGGYNFFVFNVQILGKILKLINVKAGTNYYCYCGYATAEDNMLHGNNGGLACHHITRIVGWK